MNTSILVESTMIENPTFPHKSGLSKVNIKTNRIRSTKWTKSKSKVKQQGFATSYFICSKI